MADFRHRTLKRFVAILYYFAEAIVEALSWKIAWYFYTDISAGSNGNFDGKTGSIFDCRVCSLWKIVPVSHIKFVQFVQNQTDIVKTRLVFPTENWNTEILSGARFQWSFLWILNVLIIHEFLTAGYLVFWTTVPVSRGFYSTPKPREFVHNKSKTLFRIASHFSANIEYSRRVSTSVFVEIIL